MAWRKDGVHKGRRLKWWGRLGVVGMEPTSSSYTWRCIVSELALGFPTLSLPAPFFWLLI